MRFHSLAKGLLALGLAWSAAQATAQEWPNKPLRFIVPFGPGGLIDTVMAATKPSIESRLKQQLLIDNRPGGGGMIGMQAIASAAPDGYTFGIVPSNTMVINQFIFRSSIDPLKDFVPVSVLVDVPLLLSVSAKYPARSVDEFFADVRARPGQVNFGSPGKATPPHLAAEMLARNANLSVVHIPYKGGYDAALALASNEVQFMVIAQASLGGQIASGLIRPLAVASSERLPGLPNVPTLEQAGYADLQKIIPRNWWGVIAPKGTPAAIVNRVAEEFQQALASADAQRKLKGMGLQPVGSNPAQFAAQLPDEARRWGDLIRSMGLNTP
jgi:tripartite-type tricarboxylate transporter receptor subunit TctC